MTNCTDEELAELFDLERAQRNLEVAENAPPESVVIMDTIWVELRMALAKIRLQAKEINLLVAHQDRGEGFTHHDQDDCITEACRLLDEDNSFKAGQIMGEHLYGKHGTTGTTPLERMNQAMELGRTIARDPALDVGRRQSKSMDETKGMRVAPNWADEHIAALRRGETVTFHPCGKSMEPLVMHGQRVTVEPIHPDDCDCDVFGCSRPLAIDDIVLVTVDTKNPHIDLITPRQYLHKIIDEQFASLVLHYQIANNRGKINGWVTREAIHGRMVR